eukprot:EC790981.1.p1 GENE.EC790981.1~~EC790981.1.p1  ORF type:complete len:136 (+),score=38.48 EC790981.1:53-460(+)
MASLRERLVANSDVFDQFAVVEASSGRVVDANCEVSEAEVRQILAVFDSYDAAFANGFNFAGEHYDVFRFYPDSSPPLVYGRRGDSDTGVGFAVTKFAKDGGDVFVAVSYVLPVISARAIPELVKLVGEFHAVSA